MGEQFSIQEVGITVLAVVVVGRVAFEAIRGARNAKNGSSNSNRLEKIWEQNVKMTSSMNEIKTHQKEMVDTLKSHASESTRLLKKIAGED